MARNGILTDREREWIKHQLNNPDDHSEYTTSQNKDIKYRIENHSATGENLRKTALTLSEDLVLLDEYFRYAKPQPSGKHQWDDKIRPVISDAMKKLGDTSTWLADVPDRNVGDEVRSELRRALQPLRKDLTRFREFDSGEVNVAAYSAVQEGDREAHGELLDEIDELQQRQDALNFLFGNREWYDLFTYITETPPTVQKSEDKLDENMIGGRTWNLAAAQTLRDQYGLIRDVDWGYEPNNRGETVLEAYHSISNNKYINDVARDSSIGETALYLLHSHFSADKWDDPDDL